VEATIEQLLELLQRTLETGGISTRMNAKDNTGDIQDDSQL
jgi:hypothetical protein